MAVSKSVSTTPSQASVVHVSRQGLGKYGLILALALLWFGLSILTKGRFTSPVNLGILLRQSSITGIMAMGMAFIIMSGEIDLGVGAALAMCAVLAGIMMKSGIGIALSVIAVLALGALVGVWNGFWAAHHEVLAFVVTVATMNIARGVALVTSGGVAVSPVPTRFSVWLGIGELPLIWSYGLLIVGYVLWLVASYRGHQRTVMFGLSPAGAGKWLTGAVGVGVALVAFAALIWVWKGIPTPSVMFLGVALIAHYLLQHTAFGRYVVASGGNAEAARMAGVNVKHIKFLAFVLMGLITAIGALVYLAYLGGVAPSTAGDPTPLDAIASVLIGGASSIWGTIIGALMIGTIDNGMGLLGISPFYQMIVKGFVLLIAVYIDVVSKRRTA